MELATNVAERPIKLLNNTGSQLTIIKCSVLRDDVFFQYKKDFFNIRVRTTNEDRRAGQCTLFIEHRTFTVNFKQHCSVFKITYGPDSHSLIIPPRCKVMRKFSIDVNYDVVVDAQDIGPKVFGACSIVHSKSALVSVPPKSISYQLDYTL